MNAYSHTSSPLPTQVPGRLGLRLLPAAVALAAAVFASSTMAQVKRHTNSSLDAPLMYQLLIGEMLLSGGDGTAAFDELLDAARRTRNEQLFRRAVDVALGTRSAERGLAALRAWRQARPDSLEAMRLQLQVLVALNRLPDAAEPLRSLLALSAESDRLEAMAALPQLLQRVPDKRQALAFAEQALQPHLAATGTRAVARIALARTALLAADKAKALEGLERAHQESPDATAPAGLALELLREHPHLERIVIARLNRANPPVPLRLAYARHLATAQRYTPAIEQLELATAAQPDQPNPWLTLGALHLELRHPQQAEQALLKYLALAPAAPEPSGGPGDDDDAPSAGQGRTQAWLMLAQVAEQRGDYAQAEQWLAKVETPLRALDVVARRANMLARQGQLGQARQLIRSTPETSAADGRAKLMAEAQLLRDARQWREAMQLLEQGARQFPGDTDLRYEQAMMAEKTGALDDMERLLREVIRDKPDHAHAYNALGYSLAERAVRLTEARELILKALQLSPGDPFITDSLGWAEYRLGNVAEALRHLRAAYSARPDTEIAAHLGEVLWASGQAEEARRIWREARARDAANDVLRDTLARLKVDL